MARLVNLSMRGVERGLFSLLFPLFALLSWLVMSSLTASLHSLPWPLCTTLPQPLCTTLPRPLSTMLPGPLSLPHLASFDVKQYMPHLASHGSGVERGHGFNFDSFQPFFTPLVASFHSSRSLFPLLNLWLLI